VWLAVPITVTMLAAVWVWWRGRPQPAPTVRQAMQAHQAYLDALAVPARGARNTGPTVDAAHRD
jgi:hypothetical protein